MLVIRRNETEVTVVRQRGRVVLLLTVVEGMARLGFEANKDLEVNRVEVDRQKYPTDYAEAA